jgi:hypothetical protein
MNYRGIDPPEPSDCDTANHAGEKAAHSIQKALKIWEKGARRMNTLEIYQAEVSWAKSVEFVCSIPSQGNRTVEFNLDKKFSYLVGALTSPNGVPRPYADLRVDIKAPDGNDPFSDDPDTEKIYARHSNERLQVAAMIDPPQGKWKINLSSGGSAPAAFNLAAVDPSSLHHAMPATTGASLPFRCRACKVTSKALGGACIIAAGSAVIPHALVAAVASHLAVGPAVATAFISGLVSHTVDDVAEALCRTIGLCP